MGFGIPEIGKSGFDWLTGQDQVNKANRIAREDMKKMLSELGKPGLEGDNFYNSIASLFEQALAQYGLARDEVTGQSQQAMSSLQSGYQRGRKTARAQYLQSVKSLEQGFAEAQQMAGAQAGAAVEASIRSQQQAMAQLGQNAISSGLGGAPTAAMARGIAADSSQNMAGAFAQIAQQKSGLAANKAMGLSELHQQHGLNEQRSFEQQGIGSAQISQQLGNVLAQLYGQQANIYGQQANAELNIAGLRQATRASTPYVIGQSVGQLAMQGAGMAIGAKL